MDDASAPSPLNPGAVSAPADITSPTAAATYKLDGHIATITYNRPEALNAINGEMRACLNAAWLEFYNDPDAWVAIMTGTGRAFCAGADMRDRTGGSAGIWSGTFFETPTVNSYESGLELWKPTIAAVNGACIGYGLTGALVADFLIASDRAIFGMPEVKIGVPTIVGSMRMPPKIGWANAMELLLTGDNVDAERAREMGLAWKVVPHDTLMDEARALAERLCQGAPLAVRAVKEVAWRSARMGWTEAVRMGESLRRLVAASDDATEGGRAFAEKRPPEWTGA